MIDGVLFSQRRVVVGALVASVVVAYLRWTPLAPDLAAQFARANTFRLAGTTVWSTGWFGGTTLPDYSVLAPAAMAVLGVGITGVLAAGAASVATTSLVRTTARPRCAAALFVALEAADVLNGRITFAVGFAVAAWTLLAVRSHRSLATAVLALITYLCSPLAALFLGLSLVAVAITERAHRRGSLMGATVVLVAGASAWVLFPATGTMPFRAVDMIPTVLAGLMVVVACPQRVVRVGAVLVLLSVPLFYFVPTAVGANITRLSWMCATPVLVACATIPARAVAGACALLLLWPTGDLVGQLRAARSDSADALFYQPLVTALARSTSAAGPTALGERIELIDTANHWGSAYLSSASLARGWDRQADRANNPIFYEAGRLSASSYRAWLSELAVGWVALPQAELDYAGVAEGALVQAGLPYLQPVWTDAHWRLYRVLDASPLAVGATVESIGLAGVTLRATGAGWVRTRLRWSSYLAVSAPATGAPVRSCVVNTEGWTDIYLTAPTTFLLSARFAPVHVLSGTDPDCVSDLVGASS